jgi:hypothetical protein
MPINNSVLNQKSSPAIYTDVFANRPTFGFAGRLFISTDTSQIFEDSGTAWILIANSGIGSTGTLQVVTTNGNTTNTGITISAGGLNTNAAQVSGLTQAGGVLFTDGSGNLGQDTNFNWDITSNYLGIGQTGTPTAPLDIHNATTNVFMQLNATSTNNSTLAFQNASVGKWRIGNLYDSGNNLFHIYNNTTASNLLSVTAANAATFIGSVTALSLGITGGTSGQFLKANGTVDSTAYISLTSLSATTPLSYNSGTGAFTILQSSGSSNGYLSSTDWTTFNNKAALGSFSATTPLAYNSGTGAFTIQVANSGQNGYLTSTDWNTFNNKQATITTGNLTETVSNILTISGGTGAVIGSGTTIQIQQSSATVNGYLSSTDWTTFNSKQTQINGTGFVKATGTTISYDNSTYYLASNPSSYITLASLSGTTPISYNSGTGAISIALANTSTSGYLSSTDWNTFNSKASLTAFSASPPLSYNSGTGAFSITQSSGSTNGYLSSTDWTTFNNKQSALTNPVTGSGTSNYIVKFNGSTTVTNSLIQDNGTGVGISTTPTAGYLLDVYGTATFGASATVGNKVHIGSGAVPSGAAGIGLWATGSNLFSIIGLGDTTLDARGSFLLLNPSAGGNVGIATDAPQSITEIYSATPVLTITDSNAFSSTVSRTSGIEFKALNPSSNKTTQSAGIYGVITPESGYTPNQGYLSFYTRLQGASYTEKLRITSAGNVGIGTSTPTNVASTWTTLEVAAKGAGGGGILYLTNFAKTVISQIYSDDNGAYVGTTSNNFLRFETNSTERYKITAAGINNYTSRGNYNGSTDNSLFSLNSGGTLYTTGFSPNFSTVSSTTYTMTTGATTFLYNGSGTATWTLPNPSGTNQMFWIKNVGTGIITLNAYSGTNIINNAGVGVSSITIAIGATVLIQQDGNVKSYQLQ